METALAIEEWYKGKDKYDFKTNTFKGGATAKQADKDLSNAFTQLVWSATTTVGMGVKDGWAVAWFCPKGNTPPGDFAANVKKRCTIDKMDVCVNKE